MKMEVTGLKVICRNICCEYRMVPTPDASLQFSCSCFASPKPATIIKIIIIKKKKKRQKYSHLNIHLLCMTISAQSQQLKIWRRVEGRLGVFISFTFHRTRPYYLFISTFISNLHLNQAYLL